MITASIIIVNWNGRNHLEHCIDSVLRQSWKAIEIILVDNASTDGSREVAAARYPSINIVSLKENRGFTGGNIEGMKTAHGEYIVLLNNDAVLSERWIETMIDVMESDEIIGMCASRIVIAGTNLIDSAGDLFTTAFNGTKVGEYENANSYVQRRNVHGACAAAAMYRKKMLDQIGFLDKDFFFNHEDTDLNLRAWLTGWKCIFVPEAVAYHKVSASRGTFSDFSIYYYARNIEWVWIKNVPLLMMLRFLPQRIFYEISYFGYFCIVKGKCIPFIKGKFDALRGIGKMLSKRREVQRLIRLTHQQMAVDLVPICRYIFTRLQKVPATRDFNS